MQVGGTFDASGAFRDERWSDEEDPDGKKRTRGGAKKWSSEAEHADALKKASELKESLVDSSSERQNCVENNHLVDAASISPVRSSAAESSDPATGVINEQKVKFH